MYSTSAISCTSSLPPPCLSFLFALQPAVHVAAGGSGGPGAGRRKRNNAPAGLFEVNVITPPPRYLGTYALPPLTHNNDEIEIEGVGTYVVTQLVVQYKLQQGKYKRHHSRLDVQPTSRWLTNQQLDSLLQKEVDGGTGLQD
ncbi:hypothetical protein DUNSADRAFT_11343 [Dunaliella salina]|uniref:Encoded protein n=1 Tax=Dunaliella salina TaxID=3046 RepID=A0ABQ7GDP3_DUNSA|nr:hypothetical protein DUNSADRAFT_11343 [Dunaliella salina]|eukprot:KAF5832699.1 hypothetical protein DUNSADRAFT_11343 [Dunaliella salina]